MSVPQSPAARGRFFETEGYLTPVPILAPHEIAPAQAMFERLLADHLAAGHATRLTNAHLYDSEAYALATHPAILDLAEACFGPDLVLISGGFFYKQGDGSGAYVDWHQDTTYWGLEPPKALTVWLAIYDSTVENGCMRIVPRTHHGLLPHTTSERTGNMLGHNQAIDPCHFDESTAVDCVLRAGEASVHHGELVHGSNPNRSTSMRCGMTVRFSTPDVKPVTSGEFAYKDKPILVRGQDRYGYLPLVQPAMRV